MKSFEKEYSSNRIVLKDAIPLEIPLCISLEASDTCNFKCIMCHHCNPDYDVYNPKKQNMSMELFHKCVQEIHAWTESTGKKVKVMKLYSLGEPLANPNIAEMVKIIKDLEICDLLEITSNASLLKPEISRKLVDNGLDIFRASIYSVDESRNYEITGQKKINVKIIRDNIEYMRKYRDENGKQAPFISAKMIDSYSDENDIFLNDYKEIADEAYIDKIMDLSGNKETIKKYYGKDKSEKALFDIERTRVHERKSCRYPFTHMTVKGSGKVVVCCTDWMSATEIGDVTCNTLQEIWTSKALYDFRCMTLLTKGMNNNLCKNCEIPLRDFAEDNIDGFPIAKLSYTEE